MVYWRHFTTEVTSKLLRTQAGDAAYTVRECRVHRKETPRTQAEQGPFTHPETAADSTGEGHATDQWTVALPIDQRSRYRPVNGSATFPQKVTLPTDKR
jgi:hypothetical protein